MTTIFTFTPSATQAYQFQPTLDGDVYTAIVTWSLFGQRWYLNLFDAEGNWIFTRSMVGSVPTPNPGLSLTAGYFTSTLVFRQQDQVFEVSP